MRLLADAGLTPETVQGCTLIQLYKYTHKNNSKKELHILLLKSIVLGNHKQQTLCEHNILYYHSLISHTGFGNKDQDIRGG